MPDIQVQYMFALLVTCMTKGLSYNGPIDRQCGPQESFPNHFSKISMIIFLAFIQGESSSQKSPYKCLIVNVATCAQNVQNPIHMNILGYIRTSDCIGGPLSGFVFTIFVFLPYFLLVKQGSKT